MSLRLTLLASAALLTACSSEPERQPGEGADHVLWQGAIYTASDNQPWAEAIAIKGNRIVYVGGNKGVEAFVGKNTKVTDLDDKMVTPGFIDTHAHPAMAAGMSDSVELDLNGTPDEWKQAVTDYIKENPDKPYVMGFGFLAATFGPSGPTKEMLDEIVSDRPVVLIDEGGHTAWVNSKAFELAGIDKNTLDPIPGTHFYKRDADGNPTGWCLEAMTFNPMIAKLGMISKESILEGAEDLFWLMTSFGITTSYDAGMSQFEEVSYPALAELEASQKLPFRIISSHMIQDPKQVPTAIERLRYLNKTYSSALIQPRVMKIHNDGTKEAFTAGQFDDYVGQPGNKGSVLLEGPALQDFVVDIDQAGFDIHIHAIGDRAVDEALDAFEIARKINPDSNVRYAIGHTELVRDEDLARFGALNVTAQTTPVWFATDGAGEIAAVGADRAAKLYRFDAIERAGGKVTFGSDFPAAGVPGLSPLYNIEVGMTRQYPNAPNMPVTPPVDARLSLDTMLKGYTIHAAYQLNMENDIGSLEVGKLADLTVLNANLFNIKKHDVHKVRVSMTMMDGNITYERGLKTRLFEWDSGL